MPITGRSQADKSTTSNKTIDEQLWVINIRRTLNEEIEEEDDETQVNICNVPTSMILTDPSSYIPQQVAIGPYHHCRPEVYEMERYKIAAAKRTVKNLQSPNFQNLLEQFEKSEPRIRASYHKFLNITGETLALLLAMDAAFLIEFLQICAVKEGKVLKKIPSRMSHLVDVEGQKWGHNAILRDLVMLENQIPLFIVTKMIEKQFLPEERAHNMLLSMLVGFCKEASPFKMVGNFPKCQVKGCAHLLDFVYQAIVPTSNRESEIVEIVEQCEAEVQKVASLKGPVNKIKKAFTTFNTENMQGITRTIFSKPVKTLVKVPWVICANIPGIRFLKEPVEVFFRNLNNRQEEVQEEGSSNSVSGSNKSPLVEEITIPSVTELIQSGIKILPTKGGIMSIAFDEKSGTLYLPSISLDVNSNVVLRNLVAYEAGKGSGPLILTRYTELMNGIIDSDEDTKLLRERGIIVNRLKSDAEVADLWNGMSRSVKLTKVAFLDKVINDVNKNYNGKWTVKTKKFMRSYIFESWQFLTFLATIMLLLLMSVEAFCSVYTCSRFFNFKT